METHSFDPKQAPRSITCRDKNIAREQQVLQDVKKADIFGPKCRKKKKKKISLCQGQQRPGAGDQRHLVTNIIIKV